MSVERKRTTIDMPTEDIIRQARRMGGPGPKLKADWKWCADCRGLQKITHIHFTGKRDDDDMAKIKPATFAEMSDEELEATMPKFVAGKIRELARAQFHRKPLTLKAFEALADMVDEYQDAWVAHIEVNI